MNDNVYIIVPLYNEAIVAREVICKLLEKYPNVIVVDDGSTDGSLELIKDTGAVILRHIINLGQGAAIQTGIHYAVSKGAEYIVTFDSDGQHRVEDIENLLSPIREKGYEVALGSRFLGKAINIPFIRHILLKVIVFFNRIVFGYKFSDTHNGLRAFSVSAAKNICITQNRMAHASQVLRQIHDKRMKYIEVPVTISYSSYSVTKGQKSLDGLNVILEIIEEKLLK